MTEQEKQQLHTYGIDRQNIIASLRVIQSLRRKRNRMSLAIYHERMNHVQNKLYGSLVREFAANMEN